MRNAKWFLIIGLVLIASIAFMSCDPGSAGGTAPPVEEPTPEPIPPTFEETVVGKFWLTDRIELYIDSGSRSLSSTNPYELGTCAFWGPEFIYFYEDSNDDGLLAPSEEIPLSRIPWNITGNTLTIGTDEWTVEYFNGTGWAIKAYAPEGSYLCGEDIEGWVTVHYVPCEFGVLNGNLITAEFAFVFDDMNDTTLLEISGRCQDCDNLIVADIVDGFAFDFGDQRVIIGNFALPCGGIEVSTHWRRHSSSIGINDDFFGFVATERYDAVKDEYYWVWAPICEGFEAGEVYDMTITVDTADYTDFDFVSRWDDDEFDLGVADFLQYSRLGAIEIVAVDDVDVPVVNP